jgi:hypothetical protein
MRLDIIWSGGSTPVDLVDGAFTVGGNPTDDIHLEGLPFGLLTLDVEGNRLAIKSIRPLRVGNQLFPAHVPRRVLPGESLTLPNDVVVQRPEDQAHRERRKNKSTDLLVRELIDGGFSIPESRAATLTCVAGADEGAVYPLAFLDTSVGRADDVDVRLHDRSVSRRHARVIRRRKTSYVEDLATTNGIFVNGKRVRRSKQLQTGDIIELGHTMLRFEDGEYAPDERTLIEPQNTEGLSSARPEGTTIAPALAAVRPAPPVVALGPGHGHADPVAASTPSTVTLAPHSIAEEPSITHRVNPRLNSLDSAMMLIGLLMFASGLVAIFMLTR